MKLETHTCSLSRGISRSKEFEKKGLAQFAVNIGLKCLHDCAYCSTGAMLRTHTVFSRIGRSSFEQGYAVVDPDIATKVAHDAKHKRQRGLVQLCTTVDAWCPAAQQYGLGRKCLEALLAETEWTIRILTKNAAVEKEFDLIERHRDRVLLGISITSPLRHSAKMQVVERNASFIEERVRVMEQAHRLGLRTYVMFCPMLPAIANSREDIDELVQWAEAIGAEEIFAEAVNARGKGLVLTQEALEKAGYEKEARAVEAVRKKANWSEYVKDLVANVQASVRQYSDIGKLRFLQYPSGLLPEDRLEIENDDHGVVWL
jgi:DNA repair photolyase